MSYAKSFLDNNSNVLVLSLGSGDLLMESIRDAAAKSGIHTGVILTGIGSLTKANFNCGGKTHKIEGAFEVLNLSGTIASNEPHVHISMVASDGKFVGGHLNDGCEIYTIAEIAILILDDLRLTRTQRDGCEYKLIDSE